MRQVNTCQALNACMKYCLFEDKVFLRFRKNALNMKESSYEARRFKVHYYDIMIANYLKVSCIIDANATTNHKTFGSAFSLLQVSYTQKSIFWGGEKG